jgi:class 3 adenylate cyclase
MTASLDRSLRSRRSEGQEANLRSLEAINLGVVSTASSAVTVLGRQVTIMFCDMVGSTALSTKFHQEEQRDVVSSFFRPMRRRSSIWGGIVANYLGAGVLA